MRKLEEEDETQQNDTEETEPELFEHKVMVGEIEKINSWNTEEKEHTREDKNIEALALVADLVSDMINSVWRETKMKMLTDGVAVVEKKPKTRQGIMREISARWGTNLLNYANIVCGNQFYEGFTH